MAQTLAWNDLAPEIQSLFDFSNYRDGANGTAAITLKAAIAAIYGDPVGASLIDSLLTQKNNASLGKFLPIQFIYTIGDPLTPINGNLPGNVIDIGTKITSGFINNQGEFVQYTLERALFHELWHAITKADDGSYSIGSPDNSAASLTGPTVAQENAFASSVYPSSDPESAQRSSYLAGIPTSLVDKISGKHWTDGATVDVVLTDAQQVVQGVANGKTLDLTKFDSQKKILMIALGADVTIKGSDGGDFLWSTSGANTLQGGKGDDVIHARGDNDAVIGSGGNDTIYGGASGSTTLLYKNLGGPTNLILSSDDQRNTSLTIDKGSVGTDTATGIKTLTLDGNQTNSVVIAGNPNFAGGLTIDGGSVGRSGARETIDFTLYSQALRMDNGSSVPDIGVIFKNFNFGTLIATEKDDTINVGSNAGFCAIDGGDGGDKFDIHTGGSVLAGNGGKDTFVVHVNEIKGRGPLVLWGGAGADTFSFVDGSANVLIANVSPSSTKALLNMDTNKLAADSLFGGRDSGSVPDVIIVNPDNTDQITLDGKTLRSVSYGFEAYSNSTQTYKEFGYGADGLRYFPEISGAARANLLFVESWPNPGAGDWIGILGNLNGDFGITVSGVGPSNVNYDSSTGQPVRAWTDPAHATYIANSTRYNLDPAQYA